MTILLALVNSVQKRVNIMKAIANNLVSEILQKMTSDLPGGVYFYDKNGVILWSTQDLIKLHNVDKMVSVVGKTLFDFNDRQTAEAIYENNSRIIRNGKAEVIEEKVVLNGKLHVFLSHKAPARNPDTGEIIGIIGISIDITRQKQLEETLSSKNMELMQALEVKQDFLNNMSHEVRTPLASVISLPEAIEDIWDTLTDEKKKEYVLEIGRGRDRLMNLLSNLLDLSKFHQGRAAFDLKYHDIKYTIIEAIEEFKHTTHPIDLELSSDVDTYIYCDSWRIKQVLINVIANATKHGGQNKPITISLSRMNDSLKISVKDEGVGIPEDELELIFDHFHESKRTKRQSGGTGMGLSLCRDILKGHEGKIWVENNSGAGATFHLTIPYEKQLAKIYSFRLTQKS